MKKEIKETVTLPKTISSIDQEEIVKQLIVKKVIPIVVKTVLKL